MVLSCLLRFPHLQFQLRENGSKDSTSMFFGKLPFGGQNIVSPSVFGTLLVSSPVFVHDIRSANQRRAFCQACDGTNKFILETPEISSAMWKNSCYPPSDCCVRASSYLQPSLPSTSALVCRQPSDSQVTAK